MIFKKVKKKKISNYFYYELLLKNRVFVALLIIINSSTLVINWEDPTEGKVNQMYLLHLDESFFQMETERFNR